MQRREALQTLIASLTVGAYSTPVQASQKQQAGSFGAIAPTRIEQIACKAYPSFHRKFTPLKGIARKSGKNVFLWKNLEHEIGEIAPHRQHDLPDGTESEGDCVGHASAMACDVLAASDIHYLGQRERWHAKASVEAIYWGSRVEVGENKLDGREGSRGVWGAKYLKEYGVLHRQFYRSGFNSIDLTGYNPGRSRERRDTGLPTWLESVARRHPVREISQPKSGQEVLDAVVAGQPVIMCSSYKFHRQRDAEGFCLPYVNNERGWKWDWRRGVLVPWNQWRHCMVVTGALLEGSRVGGLMQNSFGAWNKGPRPHGMPVGSFFIDLEYLDIMVNDWNDCWALSGYLGHKAKRIRRHILYTQ